MTKRNKRRLKRSSKIMLVLALSVLFYIGFTTIADKKSGSISQFIVNIETEMQETDEFTYFINIPTFNSENINEPIHQWIANEKEEFLQEVDENVMKDYRSHLNIKVDIEEVNHDFYNIILASDRYTGGANGVSSTKVFTLDTGSQELLSIYDVIKNDTKSRELLLSLVANHFKSNEATEFYIFEDMLKEAFKELDHLKWSINHKAFSLYFDKYEIAAGALGRVKVDLPLESLDSVLREEIHATLPILKTETNQADDTEQDQDSHENIATNEGKETPQEEDKLDPKGKYVALTFDDGPSQSVTPKVLETLEEYGAKATFFMLGSQVNFYPEIAKSVAEKGHEIANHTLNHLDLTVVNHEEMATEIENSRQIIKDVTGYDPLLMRPPYGAYNQTVFDHTKKYDESIILWSVDSLDWKSRNAQAINNLILDTVSPGAVVLMHDIHEATAEALPLLLEKLSKEGYEFITVSRLLKLNEEESVDVFYGNYK